MSHPVPTPPGLRQPRETGGVVVSGGAAARLNAQESSRGNPRRPREYSWAWPGSLAILGWGIEETAGGPLWFHGGNNFFVQHVVLLSPVSRTAISCFTNGVFGAKLFDTALGVAFRGHHPALPRCGGGEGRPLGSKGPG